MKHCNGTLIHKWFSHVNEGLMHFTHYNTVLFHHNSYFLSFYCYLNRPVNWCLLRTWYCRNCWVDVQQARSHVNSCRWAWVLAMPCWWGLVRLKQLSIAANAQAQSYLVDLRGNACYHVAIVPNEWLSAYLNTLIGVVFLSLKATSHKLHIFITCRCYQFCWHFLGMDIVVVINHENDEAVELKIMQNG